MIEIKQDKEQEGIYRISGEMTIYEAEKIRAIFISILKTRKEIEINLSEVTEIDTNGIQIMYAIQKEAKNISKKIRWTNHSEAILKTINILNLGNSLGETVSLEWS